jgi:hypothetical protein
MCGKSYNKFQLIIKHAHTILERLGARAAVFFLTTKGATGGNDVGGSSGG